MNPVFDEYNSSKTGFSIYIPLVARRLTILLQILAKQIIVGPHGELVEHELNPPFVRNLSPPESGMVVRNISDQGYQNSEDLEEFLTGLRFEQRGKLHLMPTNNIKSHQV